MAKGKNILSFNTRERRLWCKTTKERKDVEFVLVAELPDVNDILYASTINSEELDRRYEGNFLDKIISLALEKEKGKKQLRISKADGEIFSLYEQDFVLLFVMGAEMSENEIRDSLLIVNFPKRLKQGIFQIYFSEDQQKEMGLNLFWLLKDMI